MSTHPTLLPHERAISKSTIQKKWKPLPPHAQDKVRAVLLELRTRRAGAGGDGRIPTVGNRKARVSSGKENNGTSRASRNRLAEAEYQAVVEEVTEKYVPPLIIPRVASCSRFKLIHRLLSRLPRMPFPPSCSNTAHSTSTASAPSEFDLSATLTRIASLRATLTTTTHSTRLLERQIRREKAALKHDRAELKMLQEGMRGAKEVRRRKERGEHWIVRDMKEREQNGLEDVAKRNQVVGITTWSSTGHLREDSSTTRDSMTPLSLDDGADDDADLTRLKKQLHSHLVSVRTNTAPMIPVLEAIDATKVAIDQFAARNLEGNDLRRVLGLSPTD
jgi:hypothetical protein